MLPLHLVAWLVIVLVGMSVVLANVVGDSIMRETMLDPSDFFLVEGMEVGFGDYVVYYGWPIFCREWKETLSLTSRETESFLHPILLLLNIVADLLIVISTFFVFVFPLWRRKPFQVKLESFFILTASVAVFFALYRVPFPIDPFGVFDAPSSILLSPRFFYEFPLYLQIPLGLGIGCAIYCCIWLALRLVSALVRIPVKRRVVSQSE